jgi:hypothetical protein
MSFLGAPIPMDLNSFRYPHIGLNIDDFVPPAPASIESRAA